MEYLFYVLMILTLLALLLYTVRLPGHSRLAGRQDSLAERARRRRQIGNEASEATGPRHRHVLQREMRNVPTPWGWPGSDVRHGNAHYGPENGDSVNGGSGPFQQWIDRLVSEKRTIDDSDYLLRRDASLRTMVEDRYGRAPAPADMPFRPVRAPMLRDPGRPYDQMDNFPSGKTDRIVSTLQRQPGPRPVSKHPAARSKSASLKEIKTPWGW